MDAQKLAKVLAMAASDNESEALHALRTARRLLDGHGVDFVEVARRVAEAQPAGAGSAGAHIEDLEDAVFDLRNEIRHLRAENERLRQSRPAPVDTPSFADAARDAAAAIRLRAELAETRDRTELLEAEVLRLKAHEVQTREHLKQEMAEAARLAARVEDLDRRRLRLEAENRRLTIEAQALDGKTRKPTARARAKGSTSQYALL